MVSPKIYDYFVLVYKPKHPRAMGKGYVPEQILVAEKELGRELSPDEDVRHINGDTQDNSISNLEIISSNSSYRVVGLGSEMDYNRKRSSAYMPCSFQRQCWKEVRGPIARREKVFLPYICSNQEYGDVYKCPIFWSYVDKKMEEQAKEGGKVGKSEKG